MPSLLDWIYCVHSLYLRIARSRVLFFFGTSCQKEWIALFGRFHTDMKFVKQFARPQFWRPNIYAENNPWQIRPHTYLLEPSLTPLDHFFPSNVTLRVMRRSTCPREGASPGLWSSRHWEAGRRPESKISSSLSHSHISFQPSQIILRVKIGGDRGWKLSEVLARPPLRGFQYLLFAAESIRVLFDSASLTVLLGGMSVTYFVRFFLQICSGS